MSIQDEIYKKIKEEITKDPREIGYKGKTDDEIMNLLNTNPTITRTVIDIDVTPMSRIMQGIATAPNVISECEVTKAQKVVADIEP